MKNFNSNTILILLVIVVAIIVLIVLRKKLKVLLLPCVFLITGAPKTGKSALSVWLVKTSSFKAVLGWKIGKVFYWLIHHTLEGYRLKPMVYANIPLGFKHNRLTKDILLRKVKIPPKSIVYIDDASLLADSMSFKDDDTNYELLLFFKLYGHMSYGGKIILNSHTTSDLHYAIKRSIGRYLYIYQSTKVPFVTFCKCREMVFNDDTQMVNDISSDIELSMRTLIYPNFVYKLYDCFCYSVLTDDLMYQVDYDYSYSKKELKCKEIVTFNKLIENKTKVVKSNENLQA